jgi:xenotropic and polytropic retrovirus receptor 1
MRSSWLFYVVIPGNQHSPIITFLIALGEILRRFMWNFFRMENEHMMNAKRFMASRDVPLPFALPESKAINEEPSSYLDYSRVDEGRAGRERDRADYV